MDRQNKRNIVTLATFFVVILLFCVKATGVHIHMLVGLAFIAALMVHTIRRWRRLLKCPICLQIADIVALTALVAVLVSGFMIPFLRGAMWVLLIHKLTSVILAVSIAVHIWQHMPKKKR